MRAVIDFTFKTTKEDRYPILALNLVIKAVAYKIKNTFSLV